MWIARFSLPVTAAVQAVTDRLPGAGWDRRSACVARQARFAAESVRAGGASDDHGGGHGANAALLEQLWGVCLEQAGELSERSDRQVLNSLADRGQRDRLGVDRVRLPRRPGGFPGLAGQ